MIRCNEDGWICVAMHDPSGRRGLWYRLTAEGIEICAGREGDDDFVKIPFDNPAFEGVSDCMQSAGYAGYQAYPYDIPGKFAATKRWELRREIVAGIEFLEDPENLKLAHEDLAYIDSLDAKWRESDRSDLTAENFQG